MSNPIQNFIQDNNQLVAAKPKNSNSLTTGEKIMKSIMQATTVKQKTLVSPAEVRLFD